MDDVKKRKIEKVRKRAERIALVICIILLIIFGFQYPQLSTKKAELSNALDQSTEKFQKLEKTHSQTLTLISEKNDEIKVLKKELSKITERLDGIKNDDDLLKHDIFLYISNKFQTIPKTTAHEIANQIMKVSQVENVSPELIVGIIQVESSFNPMSISKKNARGLMQVMPEWAKKFKLQYVNDLHDIDTNIQCGVKVLKIHIKEQKGSITQGLYYYVGKSDSYASKVYEAIGKFVSFRSTVDGDDNTDENQSPEIEQER